MEYRREIDGLRALAVIPVMLFHAGYGAFSGGFVGVDVFFVISGYLITGLISADIEQGRFSIVNFYERRARRILPALFLVMAVCLPCAWVWLPPADLKQFCSSMVGVALFVSNIFFRRQSGYFDTAAELKPLLHTWSLSVEEQYYLFFPLLLLLAWRWGRRRLLLVLAVVALISFGLAEWRSLAQPEAAFYLLSTRGWELLLGAGAALVSRHGGLPARARPAWREAGAALGVASILCAVFTYGKATPFPGVYALAPTLGAVLVILCATPATFTGRLLGHRVLVGVGLVSYSAYLWHQPLFAFLRHSSFKESPAVYLLLLAATLVLAYLTWRYVEQPFRQKRHFSRKAIFTSAGVLSAAFVLLGAAGSRSQGYEDRPGMRIFNDLAYDLPAQRYDSCAPELKGAQPRLTYCDGTANAPTALLIGDSHADDKFDGIRLALPTYRWALIGNSSCPPLLGARIRSMDGTDCTARLAQVYAYLDRQKSVKLVLLSFAHMYPLPRLLAADHLQRGFDPRNFVIDGVSAPAGRKVDLFYAGLERTVEFLEARGIQTVILLDVPELNFFPADCLKGKVDCGFDKAGVIERQEVLRLRVQALSRRHPNLRVFDPLPVFCPDAHCRILQDGRPVYRDSHHLSRYGSLRYGRAFAHWYAESDAPQADLR